MIVYMIRHADKRRGLYPNPDLPLQDPPLSRYGGAQAGKLYGYFKDKLITEIYCSSYLRTRQTIERVSRKLRVPLVVDPRLNEINLGNVEGHSDEEIAERFPDMWAAYLRKDADFQFPGGESGGEAQRRILDFLEEKRGAPGSCILVSHDGLIRCLFCHIVGIPVHRRFDLRVDLCGVMEFEAAETAAGWRLLRYNHIPIRMSKRGEG